MKIALLGYGKMGKMIERIALERGHEINLKIDELTIDQLTIDNLKKCDVAIEFSTPHAVLQNIKKCLDAQTPIVVGTTGWNAQLKEVEQQTLAQNSCLLYGSNFSVGVNIFFALNKQLSAMMSQYSDNYRALLEEIHHIHKLDAPSGTAITLAEGVLQNFKEQTQWEGILHPNKKDFAPHVLPIVAYREGEVPGTHSIKYTSKIDDIEIKHTAHNREGFALGAVLAAEWVKNKKGFYNVTQMFDF